MKFEDLKPAQQLCKIMTRIYDGKLTTVSGGNLSIKDKDGNIWITPSGGDKGRYKEDDILKITKNEKVEGKGKPSVETAIHKALFKARPEFKAVVHAHPPSLVAVSLLREIPETMILPKVANSVKNLRLATYGCPGSDELKDNVERAFRETETTNAAILENHGAFVAGSESLKATFGIFQDLDFSIKIQAKAIAFSGKKPKLITKEQLEEYNNASLPDISSVAPVVDKNFAKKLIQPKFCVEERDLREIICDFADRAYKRGLITQNIGVISARLDSNSFIITKTGADNAELTPEQLVTIRGGVSEVGKVPSKSVLLHKKIYEENPQINSIIMAAPVNAMVFAVTDIEYDLKTIPEGYIVLREAISKFPFGVTIKKQEELAEYFKNTSPVAIVENDCYICTGTSVFNAFDKLEVVEFSAEAVIQAKLLGGEIKPITMEQVEEIKYRFKI